LWLTLWHLKRFQVIPDQFKGLEVSIFNDNRNQKLDSSKRENHWPYLMKRETTARHIKKNRDFAGKTMNPSTCYKDNVARLTILCSNNVKYRNSRLERRWEFKKSSINRPTKWKNFKIIWIKDIVKIEIKLLGIFMLKYWR